MPEIPYRAVMGHCLEPCRLPRSVVDLFGKSVVALSIADPSLPDCPLVVVNARFCEVTGYAPDEALGRNCRFLQPPGGAGPVREEMRAYLADPQRTEARFVIGNVRRDGTPFLNFVYLNKLRDRDGGSLILGSQFALDLDRHREHLYAQALRENLVAMSDLFQDNEWTMLGSMTALANSAALIAQHRLEGDI